MSPINRTVLMLASTAPRWEGDSTPRFVLDLASNLAELGWGIHLLAPGHPGAARKEVLEGVTIHRFQYMWPEGWQSLCYGGGMLPNIRSKPGRAALVPPFLYAAYREARRLVAELKPALIHAHWIVPMGWIGSLVAPESLPFIVTVHGSDALDLKGGLMDRVRRKVIARADAITCNGSITRNAVAGLFSAESKPIVTIPMGAREPDPAIRNDIPLRAGRINILFAGRLFSGKGLDDLLDALAGFDAEERPFLFVAGTGPEEERFKERTRSLNLLNDVEFLGGIENRKLLALMGAVNAVVAPTRNTEWTEAQGLVVAEAMLAQTPIIATRGGGAEDHIVHKQTGLLVSPSDPVGITNALRDIIQDRDHATEMLCSAFAYAKGGLAWTATAKKFDSLFCSLARKEPVTSC
jgi:glycosyltransferase involved in cell wall biosynthesis